MRTGWDVKYSPQSCVKPVQREGGMKRILLQTTIQYERNNWSIERFSVLADTLTGVQDEFGNRLFQIAARDRESLASGNDRLLSRLDESDIDQLWLFGVDAG